MFVIRTILPIIVLCAVTIATSRNKRQVTFQKGSAFTVTLAMSTFLPKDTLPKKILTGLAHILEVDLAYPLPESLTLHRRPADANKKMKKSRPAVSAAPARVPEAHYYIDIPDKRRKWNTKRRGRLLDSLSHFMDSEGLNGDDCIERLACEAYNHLLPNRSMMEHIIISIVSTFSSIQQCQHYQPTACNISLLQVIMNGQLAEVTPWQ